MQMVESCSPCFSPHHAATSACNAEATSRCWTLACLLFLCLFTLRIASGWLAPKAVIQFHSWPQQWQKTNQAASAGFTQILCYLIVLFDF